jgi:MFS family permease
LTIVFNLQVLVGFGLAPLLIGLVRSRAGWPVVLAVAASGFILSSALLLGLKTHANPVPSRRSVRADIMEGFRVVGAAALLRQLMFATVIGYAMTGPMQILLPKLARFELGLSEALRGAYLGLLAISLIIGGVLALTLAKRVHHGRTIFGGIALGSMLFALLATIRSPALSAMVLACVGILGGMVISLVVSGIQVQAPEAFRGRVMSMYAIASQVMPAASGVLAGALVSQMGVRLAIAGAGMALASVAVLAALNMPALRRYSGR